MSTLYRQEPSAYDGEDPSRDVPALLAYQFDQLGIGDHLTLVGTTYGLPMVDNLVPPGLGCCRARAVDEALWPKGADLCAVVTWSPDHAISRRGNAEELAEHRQKRTPAVLEALESLGYTVRIPGPLQEHETPWAPSKFFIYRLMEGADPIEWPDDGWDHHAKPGVRRRIWEPDESSLWHLESLMEKAGLAGRDTYLRRWTPISGGRTAARRWTVSSGRRTPSCACVCSGGPRRMPPPRTGLRPW